MNDLDLPIIGLIVIGVYVVLGVIGWIFKLVEACNICRELQAEGRDPHYVRPSLPQDEAYWAQFDTQVAYVNGQAVTVVQVNSSDDKKKKKSKDKQSAKQKPTRPMKKPKKPQKRKKRKKDPRKCPFCQQSDLADARLIDNAWTCVQCARKLYGHCKECDERGKLNQTVCRNDVCGRVLVEMLDE